MLRRVVALALCALAAASADVPAEPVSDDDPPSECVQLVKVSRIVHVPSATSSVRESYAVPSYSWEAPSWSQQWPSVSASSYSPDMPSLTYPSVSLPTLSYAAPAYSSRAWSSLSALTPTSASLETEAPETRAQPVVVPKFVERTCAAPPCTQRVPVPVTVPVPVGTQGACVPQTLTATVTERYAACGYEGDGPAVTSASQATVTVTVSTYDSVFASVSAEFGSVLARMSAPTACPRRLH